MSLAPDRLSAYTLLTIGDGLVSQMPALMVWTPPDPPPGLEGGRRSAGFSPCSTARAPLARATLAHDLGPAPTTLAVLVPGLQPSLLLLSAGAGGLACLKPAAGKGTSNSPPRRPDGPPKAIATALRPSIRTNRRPPRSSALRPSATAAARACEPDGGAAAP